MKTHRFATSDGGQTWTYLPNFGPTGSSTILKLDISDRVVRISGQAKGSALSALYPNPTTDRFYVNAPQGEILLPGAIFDALGRKVKTQALNATKTIEVGELSPGAYLVEIGSADNIYTHKLIIQNK